MHVETLTAETETGRQAIQEVMRHAYMADLSAGPPEWARVRVVDGVPVSFIIVDPQRSLDYPGGDLPYAFICDVATRTDRRNKGHFAAILQDTLNALHATGFAFVILHGSCHLYRRFGFDVFTHHAGIFITPEQIENKLGPADPGVAEDILTFELGGSLLSDRLLIGDIQARTLAECKATLRSAALTARKYGKGYILFIHPSAPSYGSRYPLYTSLHTRFTALAHACGAEVCVQAAAPEGESIPDADWIKVLDAPLFVRQATQAQAYKGYHRCVLAMQTDAGALTIRADHYGVAVDEGISDEADYCITWPAAAVAQLVTGFRAADESAARLQTPLAPDALALLNHLFPRRWRLSVNESWIYQH